MGTFVVFMSFIYFLLAEIQHIFTRFKKKTNSCLADFKIYYIFAKTNFIITYKPFFATRQTIACNNDI